MQGTVKYLVVTNHLQLTINNKKVQTAEIKIVVLFG